MKIQFGRLVTLSLNKTDPHDEFAVADELELGNDS